MASPLDHRILPAAYAPEPVVIVQPAPMLAQLQARPPSGAEALRAATWDPGSPNWCRRGSNSRTTRSSTGRRRRRARWLARSHNWAAEMVFEKAS